MSSAAILQHGEGEAAVALGSQFNIVGALDHHSLLQVTGLITHVSIAVLAVVGDVLAGLVGQQAHEGKLGGHALGAEGLIIVGKLSTTVDGLSEPDVLLALGASEPVLAGDALGVGMDAGLTGGEVAEDLDGVIDASLVGVNPVESVAPFGVAELDVTAGAGRVLPGSLRGEQVLDLSVEGLDGGIDLVVLGSQRGLISSVLIVSRDIISTTSGAGRSGQTGRSSRTSRSKVSRGSTSTRRANGSMATGSAILTRGSVGSSGSSGSGRSI